MLQSKPVKLLALQLCSKSFGQRYLWELALFIREPINCLDYYTFQMQHTCANCSSNYCQNHILG